MHSEAPHARRRRVHPGALAACALSWAVRAAAQSSVPPPPASQPSASQPASQPAATIVRGQVLNHVGGGVEKVAVAVEVADGDAATRPSGTYFTDEMGDFAVTAEQRVDGHLVVRFRKPGFATLTREVDVKRKGKTPFLDVEMVGGLRVTGQVREVAEDAPVRHARVVVRSAYKELTGETDEDGRFEVAEVMPGDAELVIEADGFGRHRQRLRASEDMEALHIALKPQRIVHLSITDADGRPIAGATVETLDEQREDFRTSVTGEDGRVDLRGLSFDATALAIRLTHERYASSSEFDRSIELPSDAIESRHTLTMTVAGVVTGVIKDATSGEPLGSARVIAGVRIRSGMPTAWTDFDGRFRLTGVPPGQTALTVHLTGYAPALQPVTISPSDEISVVIALSAAATVSGQVVDPDGKGIREAYVWAGRWRDFETLGLQAIADDTGHFEIANAPGDEFELIVMANGFEPLKGATISAARKDATFTLKRASSPDRETATGPAIGASAPAFDVTSLEGHKLSLDKLRGKVVLLDFWATWCGPCVAELPNLIKVHEAFAKRGDFVMISVSLDQNEQALREFIKKRKMTWHQVFGDDGGSETAANAYGVQTIPAIFIIDRDGKLAATNLRGEAVRNQLQKIIDAQPPARQP